MWAAVEIIKAKTGLPNPPEWVICALLKKPYIPNI
jgi:hypothetical protein